MLEKLKAEMAALMKNQTENIKELVQHSVNESLTKRKEQVLAKKESKKDGSSDGGSAITKDSKLKNFYEQKLHEFQQAVEEKQRKVAELETEVTQYRETEDNRDTELETLQKQLAEKSEALKRKEQE